MIQLNHSNKSDMGGNATDLFLGRKSRGHLPGSRRMPDREEMLIKRQKAVEKIFRKRKNENKEKFSIRDTVLMQDPSSKSWRMKGKVSEARKSPDGSEVTYVIEGLEGGTYLRNNKMIQL